MPSLIVRYQTGAKAHPITVGTPFVIGRSAECDVVLNSPLVSEKHAVIVINNGLAAIKNRNAASVTMLNGKRITAPRALVDGDVITIPPYVMLFYSDITAIAGERFGDSSAAPPPPQLVVRLKESMAVYPIPEGRPLLLGRNPQCDIVLPSPMVSGSHALIKAKSGMIGIKDLNTSNGTFVNGARLSVPVRLMDGDIITLQPFIIICLDPAGRNRSGTSNRLDPGRAAEREEKTSQMLEDLVKGTAAVSLRHDEGRETRIILSPSVAFPISPPAGEKPPATNDEMSTGTETDKKARTSKNETTRVYGGPKLSNIDSFHVDAAETKIQEDAAAIREEVGEEVGADESETKLLPHPDDNDAEYQDEGGDESDPPVLGAIEDLDPSRNGAIAPFPVTPAIRRLVEERLQVHVQLADLERERREFRLAQSPLPAEVENVLNRQDEELKDIPTAKEADALICKTFGENQEGVEGSGFTAAATEEMRVAGNMARMQWLICRDVGRETLSRIFIAAYAHMADEPLAGDLDAAGIVCLDLFGGGAYLLALEQLLQEAQKSEMETTSSSSSRLKAVSGCSETSRLLLRLGSVTRIFTDRETQKRDKDQKPQAKTNAHAIRIMIIRRELAHMERVLAEAFWRVYAQAAVRFVPQGRKMPEAVRAFLRYGVIGFKPWWMREELRDRIHKACATDIVLNCNRGAQATNIFFADEYMYSVMNRECAPSPDEDMERADKHSLAWKTDRAYRRMVEGTLFASFLERIRDEIAGKENQLDAEWRVAWEEAEQFRARRYGLLAEEQRLFKNAEQLASRRESMTYRRKNLEKRIALVMDESVRKNQKRFADGELSLPGPEALIRFECAAIRNMCHRMCGTRERFLPLYFRGYFLPGGDTEVGRELVHRHFDEIERRDPEIFQETVVNAKARANRISMRFPPVFLILPSPGNAGFCICPRDGMNGGLAVLPGSFLYQGTADKRCAHLASDFRWDTSMRLAGREPKKSETLVAAFLKVRDEWRPYPREKRERGYIYCNQADRMNWRRVYEVYLAGADDGCKKLFMRNRDLYSALIGKYIDLPQGVEIMHK